MATKAQIVAVTLTAVTGVRAMKHGSDVVLGI
jgi:hypothetical protein